MSQRGKKVPKHPLQKGARVGQKEAQTGALTDPSGGWSPWCPRVLCSNSLSSWCPCPMLLSRPPKTVLIEASRQMYSSAGMVCALLVLIWLLSLLSAAPCRFIFSQVRRTATWAEGNKYLTACNAASYDFTAFAVDTLSLVLMSANYTSTLLVLWNARKDTFHIWQSSWFFTALVLLFTWTLLANWSTGKRQFLFVGSFGGSVRHRKMISWTRGQMLRLETI